MRKQASSDALNNNLLPKADPVNASGPAAADGSNANRGAQGQKRWSWWGDPEQLPARKQKNRRLFLQEEEEPVLRAEDFVVAIATHKAREPILAAGRPSRQVHLRSSSCQIPVISSSAAMA